jgi:hypothetical protein
MASDYLSIAPNLTQNRNPFNYEKVEQIGRDFVTAWLTLDQITQQLNLFEDESQDSYLQGLEIATRMAIEDYLGMAIFPTQYRVFYGNPAVAGTAVTLDLPETTQNQTGQVGVTINSVKYWDGNIPSQLQTLSSSSYQYDSTGNQIIVNSIPSEISTQVANPIVVEYTTARSPLANYPVIQQAGLLLLTHLYNNRSNSNTAVMHDIPFGVTTLLRPYKPLVM